MVAHDTAADAYKLGATRSLCVGYGCPAAAPRSYRSVTGSTPMQGCGQASPRIVANAEGLSDECEKPYAKPPLSNAVHAGGAIRC